jgi:hypothetical protein
MNPRPRLKEEYKRSERIIITYTQKEIETINQLWELHDCRDRVEYIRQVSLGKIKVDLKKLNQN